MRKSGLRKLAKPEERESYRAHVLEKFKSIFENFVRVELRPFLPSFVQNGSVITEIELLEYKSFASK